MTFPVNQVISTGNVVVAGQLIPSWVTPGVTVTFPVIPNYLTGLTLANDGTSPNSVIDIAAGACADSTNANWIQLGTFTKSTAGSWVAGSGQNGMGTGLTVAINTWYHVFAILNSGTADVYFDTSVTAANAPTNTTAFRRIGSFKTDGSAHILTFVQDGVYFEWKAPVTDFNAASQGTSAVLYTVSVPLGVIVRWIGNIHILDSANSTLLYASDPATNDVAPTQNSATAPGSTVLNNNTTVDAVMFVSGGIRTNTSSQIRARSSTGDATTSLRIFTLGWMDYLGR